MSLKTLILYVTIPFEPFLVNQKELLDSIDHHSLEASELVEHFVDYIVYFKQLHPYTVHYEELIDGLYNDILWLKLRDLTGYDQEVIEKTLNLFWNIYFYLESLLDQVVANYQQLLRQHIFDYPTQDPHSITLEVERWLQHDFIIKGY